VAVATAWAWQRTREAAAPSLFEAVLSRMPEGETKRGVERACQIPLDTWEFSVAELLGNGSRVLASDTVPFCLWSTARNIDDYCEALWTTAMVGGDIDTNCAIVGGIVALAVGEKACRSLGFATASLCSGLVDAGSGTACGGPANAVQ
jgi:ADP-ribosylglycohydrolase